MKVDVLSLIQIINMLILITVALGYINYLRAEGGKRKKHTIVQTQSDIRISYSKTFVCGEYKIFEKIDIWRYCSLF